MPSAVELAWTAGIIDSDGSITLTARSKGPFRSPVVAVDNTDVEILHELSRLYGGHTVVKKKARQHHRQAWAWRLVGSQSVIALLSQLLPYMRCAVKADRARMLVGEYRMVTPRNGVYTPEMRTQRLDFERRFFALGPGRGRMCRPHAESQGVEP